MHKRAISLWLEIETRCNLACRFCYNFWRDGSVTEPRVLATADLLRGLDLLFESFECDQVALSGGEPMLRRDLEDIVRFLHARGLRIVLTTNGSLLTSSKLEALRTLGVDTIQVSLHSARQEEHDWLSQGTSFRSALQALMLARQRGMGVAAVFVATRSNLARFPNLLELLALIDVRSVIFNRFIVSGLGNRHRTELTISDEREIIQTLCAADAVAPQNGQTIFMGTPVNVDDNVRSRLSSVRFGACPVSERQRRWTIGADGEIRFCNHSAKGVGNILGDGICRLIERFDA